LGRPALGAAAKTKTGGVRVTETEDERFKREFGSLGKFLQLKVNEQFAIWREQDAERRADISPRQVMK
jgi:hypothetical protein